MSPFKWTTAHSVYLAEIDAEHRALYRLGDELHKALLAGVPADKLKPIATSLLESAEQHFRHEERLMHAMRYSSADWHKRQHDAARKKCKALVKGLNGGDTAAAAELLNAIGGWLHDHMGVADRMMGASLRNYLCFNTSLAS